MTKVKITLYSDKIKQLDQAVKTAFEMTVEAVISDIKTSQVVPKDTSALEDSLFPEVDVDRLVAWIILDTPYARRLYWHPEYNFRTDKNPNARGLWMHPYIDGDKKGFVIQTFAMFLKQQSGGLIT